MKHWRFRIGFQNNFSHFIYIYFDQSAVGNGNANNDSGSGVLRSQNEGAAESHLIGSVPLNDLANNIAPPMQAGMLLPMQPNGNQYRRNLFVSFVGRFALPLSLPMIWMKRF